MRRDPTILRVSRRRPVWLLLALLCLPALAGAQTLRIAHTNTHQGFDQQLKLAAQQVGLTLTLEFVDTVVLNETVMRSASANQCPDAVIMSADNLAKTALAFSPITPDLLSPDLDDRTLAFTRLDGRIYGIPLICGNHLMLYYDKSRVAQPGTALEEFPAPTADEHHAIVWNHATMYYFWPFVLAYDGSPLGPDRLAMDNPGLTRALEHYIAEGRRLKLKTVLDHAWSLAAFTEGRADRLIDGDWSLGLLEAKLGTNLGIAPLPAVNGRPLPSPGTAFVLAFPNQNLTKEKQAALKQLAHCLQGPGFQTAIWTKMRAIPASERVAAQAMQSEDEPIKRSIANFRSAVPLLPDPNLPLVWEVLEKGYARQADGYYPPAVTSAYMQQLAEKSLRAGSPRAP